MPRYERRVATATEVPAILQRRHHVRDTSQTEAETKQSSPSAVLNQLVYALVYIVDIGLGMN